MLLITAIVTTCYLCPGEGPPDPARASEGVARAVCVALLPSLETLRQEEKSPLAVRVSTQPDNVSKDVKSGLKYLIIHYVILIAASLTFYVLLDTWTNFICL